MAVTIVLEAGDTNEDELAAALRQAAEEVEQGNREWLEQHIFGYLKYQVTGTPMNEEEQEQQL